MRKLDIKKIIITSAIKSVPKNMMQYYIQDQNHIPRIGDIVLGRVKRISQYSELENRSGRIHQIFHGTLGLLSWGNRYATEFYEGIIPDKPVSRCDLLARGGVIGEVKSKCSSAKDPTKIDILGYVCDKEGNILNTTDFKPAIKKNNTKNKCKNLILVVGSAMNAGKSTAAKAIIYSLASNNKCVCSGKVTGTASLKDLLLMEDAGSQETIDFTFWGYPSTYLLDFDIILEIFENSYSYLNARTKDYVVLEIADGILQRETSFLLKNEKVKEKIHRLILCCNNAVTAKGGLSIVEHQYGLKVNAISGMAANSYLGQQEIRQFTDIPLFNSMEIDTSLVYNIVK